MTTTCVVLSVEAGGVSRPTLVLCGGCFSFIYRFLDGGCGGVGSRRPSSLLCGRSREAEGALLLVAATRVARRPATRPRLLSARDEH